ncbi:MAG: hybrid sensor histidine kinase/response regulator [Myxococcales bacterium]|nr:hybrid sensor histidine kinase/response regulator [Myxococcales bacterium]
MAGRHTVLVVDDEPEVVKSVQDLLRLDYRVIGATRASEGMAILAREEVHVVMADQRMPGMTGVEFLHRVRGQYPEAIRLLFTGYADLRAVIDAINQGNVYRYITKPWDPDEIQSVIRGAVEHYDLLVDRRRLLTAVQRSNVELAEKNRELAESDRLKAAFIQVASHELRTPLTILVGMSQLAHARKAELPRPQRDWVEHIARASQRLHHLVDQIVTMLIAGKYERPLERRPVDLAGLLREAADDVRPFIELRGQTLALDLPAGLGTLPVEAAKIRDSVNHLLLNAIKFTPDGGAITLAAGRSDGGGAQIRVRDTGVGIDEASLARLFEPFFTGFDPGHHASGRFEFGTRGLGLGLTVVNAFVEMHGGTVAAESKAGLGSTFTVTLPGEPAPEGR